MLSIEIQTTNTAHRRKDEDLQPTRHSGLELAETENILKEIFCHSQERIACECQEL